MFLLFVDDAALVANKVEYIIYYSRPRFVVHSTTDNKCGIHQRISRATSPDYRGRYCYSYEIEKFKIFTSNNDQYTHNKFFKLLKTMKLTTVNATIVYDALTMTLSPYSHCSPNNFDRTRTCTAKVNQLGVSWVYPSSVLHLKVLESFLCRSDLVALFTRTERAPKD